RPVTGMRARNEKKTLSVTLWRSDRRRSISRVRTGIFRKEGPRGGAMSVSSQGDEVVSENGDQPRGGDGQDPSPDDPVGHPPADGREAMGGPHSHDGAGDGVGGAHGDAQERGSQQRQPA